MRHQGRLKAWKADRGFGFITSSDIEGDVFLHISALPSNIRPPQVGDTILFELQIQPDGRKRAAKAAIQGIPPTSSHPSTPSRTINRSHIYKSANKSSKHRNSLGALLFLVVAVVLGIRFMGGLIQPTIGQPDITTDILKDGTDCNIKGNISIDTHQKIYHAPGMKDYEITKIRPEYGERWFCSEEEAVENGWTRGPD